MMGGVLIYQIWFSFGLQEKVTVMYITIFNQTIYVIGDKLISLGCKSYKKKSPI